MCEHGKNTQTVLMIAEKHLVVIIHKNYRHFHKKELFNLIVGIFYPMGELISLHLLRCGPFVVEYHNFMGRRLTSAATSTRK